jgi:hypothetical protein
MIPIRRGKEPDPLTHTRARELAKMAALGRPPTSKEISGYEIVGKELWRAQHRKCCYCEMIIAKDYNDVEHYRPKASAQCAPGPTRSYGYWWLAWTWDNLLFICPACNRSKKRDQFPLSSGSVPLNDHETPPGQELPLLLDPAGGINPLEHIVFTREAASRGEAEHWRAKPRHGSALGNYSILVYGLNSDELIELRDDYYERIIARRIKKLQAALAGGHPGAINEEFDEALRLLLAAQPYVALAYDALRGAIADAQLLQTIGRQWPDHAEIPLTTSP